MPLSNWLITAVGSVHRSESVWRGKRREGGGGREVVEGGGGSVTSEQVLRKMTLILYIQLNSWNRCAVVGGAAKCCQM